MATQTFKSRIDKLINDLGGNPKPGPIDIRNRLIKFSALAEALESGQSSIEAEQKIAALEATVNELQAKLESADAQAENLQATLDSARDDLRRIQKQEAEHEALSDIEAKILSLISSGGEGDRNFIAHHLKVSEWVAMSALRDLEESGLLKPQSAGLHPFLMLTKKGKAWLSKNRPPRPSALS